MAQVIAAFTDFLVCSQDAVHGADRAMVDALVEQEGVELGGGLVRKHQRELCVGNKTRRAREIEYGSTFHDSQRASWARPRPKRGQRPGRTGTPTVDAGARHVQGGCEVNTGLVLGTARARTAL